MKIFVFGNQLIAEDSSAISLIPLLTKLFPAIQFIPADPTENWYQNEKELVIMDTVVGINKVTIFNSLGEFEKTSRITPHDYDLYFDLQLMIKVGNVKKVTIIGIPISQTKQILQQVVNVISQL